MTINFYIQQDCKENLIIMHAFSVFINIGYECQILHSMHRLSCASGTNNTIWGITFVMYHKEQ